MIRLAILAAILPVALAVASLPAEAKRGRLPSAAATKPAPAQPAPAQQGASRSFFFAAPVGFVAPAAAAQPPSEQQRRQASPAVEPSPAPARPAANPDARRLPVLGGDPGDTRPARGFVALN